MVTKGTVIVTHGSTYSGILGRDVRFVLDAAIFVLQQTEREIQISIDLINTSLESVARTIELVATHRGILWCQNDGNTHELAVIGISSMSTQEVEIVQGAQSVRLTLEVVIVQCIEHVRLSPFYLVAVSQHDVTIVDCIVTVAPLVNWIHLSSPRTCSHAEIIACQIVGDGIICCQVTLRACLIRQQNIGICQDSLCKRRLLIHRLKLALVLGSRFEQIIAAGENSRCY